MEQSAAYDRSVYARLARADETYGNLPQKMMLAVDALSRSLPAPGTRLVQRSGSGMEFHQIRDFNADYDDPRLKNARLSAKGTPKVIEWQPELRHDFFLYRDATRSTDFSSLKNGMTVREAEEIMLLAIAKHIAKNEDNIGIIGNSKSYNGSKSFHRIAAHLSVNIVTGNDMPVMPKHIPQNSTVIIFSDAMMSPEHINSTLKKFSAAQANGYFVMVSDPETLDYTQKGVLRFNGMEGEGSVVFNDAASKRQDYLNRIQDHIKSVEATVKKNRFQFILQRTDEPLQNGLLAMFGMAPAISPRAFAAPLPGRG